MKLLASYTLISHFLTAFGAAGRTAHIYIPPVVQAGAPVDATITVEFNTLSNATYAYALRVYLASSPYAQMALDYYQTHCYLIHEQSLCEPTIAFSKNSSIMTFDNTLITVTIPPTVGPSGRNYVLAARVMNTDGSHYTSQVFSDVFELTGANGTWSGLQRDGRSLWGDDGMSCIGWSCVKDCATTAGISTVMVTFPRDYSNCINACPGVSVHQSPSHGGVDGGPLVDPAACPSSSFAMTPTTLNGVPSKAYDLPPFNEALAAYTCAAVSRQRPTIMEVSLFMPLLMATFMAYM